MGKTGKWLKSFLTGKKDKEKERCASNENPSNVNENPATSTLILLTTPKEKRRWSFRRSSATAAAPKDLNSAETVPTTQTVVQEAVVVDNEDKQKKHALAVAAAAQAAAAAIQLTAAATGRASAIEEAAAIKIQSVFRSYLARQALCALKGLVKLQALVRGHLVRKQAIATLRCMQALVTVQARAQAQRLGMADESKPPVNPRQSTRRKSTQENLFRHGYSEIDRGMEENMKMVEMDHGESKGSTKSRNSYSSHPLSERAECRFSTYYPSNLAYSKQDNYEVSPAPSALTDMSPRACSGQFEDYSYGTAQSSPQYYSAVSKPDPSIDPLAFPRPDYAESLSFDHPLFPNYMANTESSRAKVRSQSAPKSRPADSLERQPSRRKASMEGRNNIPRAVRMQRSSSHLGSTAQNIQYPWSIKLDRSIVSVKDSECGSTTSTVLTNANYCRSLFAYDHHGNRC